MTILVILAIYSGLSLVFNLVLLLTCKSFGVRVEKAYFWNNPWFSIYRTRIGETEFGIGWVPLGGYVKIAGVIDEEVDETLPSGQREVRPYEFRNQPPYAQYLIQLSGSLGMFLAFLVTWLLVAGPTQESFSALGLFCLPLGGLMVFPIPLIRIFGGNREQPAGAGEVFLISLLTVVLFSGLVATLGWFGNQLSPAFDYLFGVLKGAYTYTDFIAPIAAINWANVGLSLCFLAPWLNLIPLGATNGGQIVTGMIFNLSGLRKHGTFMMAFNGVGTVALLIFYVYLAYCLFF